jgi:hypothetical protein
VVCLPYALRSVCTSVRRASGSFLGSLSASISTKTAHGYVHHTGFSVAENFENERKKGERRTLNTQTRFATERRAPPDLPPSLA